MGSNNLENPDQAHAFDTGSDDQDIDAQDIEEQEPSQDDQASLDAETDGGDLSQLSVPMLKKLAEEFGVSSQEFANQDNPVEFLRGLMHSWRSYQKGYNDKSQEAALLKRQMAVSQGQSHLPTEEEIEKDQEELLANPAGYMRRKYSELRQQEMQQQASEYADGENLKIDMFIRQHPEYSPYIPSVQQWINGLNAQGRVATAADVQEYCKYMAYQDGERARSLRNEGASGALEKERIKKGLSGGHGGTGSGMRNRMGAIEQWKKKVKACKSSEELEKLWEETPDYIKTGSFSQ